MSRERRATNSTSATSSIGGSVLGSATMVVTPPAAAARLALSIDSSCSAPGSRSCTRMSMMPGATQAPLHSMVSMPGPLARSGPSARDAPILDQKVAAHIELLRRVEQPRAA